MTVDQVQQTMILAAAWSVVWGYPAQKQLTGDPGQSREVTRLVVRTCLQLEKQAVQEAARRAEEAAVKAYRRSLRFKAHPVPRFPAPRAPQPSSKPLTNPKTPKLGRKRKADQW